MELGPNADPLIRRLGIPARGVYLGHSFQGHAAVRALSEADHRLLTTFALELPVLERVALYPEDQFEARLIHGEAARPLVLREDVSAYSTRLAYLYESVDCRQASRNALRLQELYQGRRQLCLFDPVDRYGCLLCHGHHIQRLSRGGDDEPDNLVLVCPNHHAAIHRDDAPFDYRTLGFSFSIAGFEALRLNLHLPRAV